MPKAIPFNQRFGTDLPDRPIDKEVSASARLGLVGILNKLVKKSYVPSWSVLADEALHAGRRLSQDFPKTQDDDICAAIIKEMPWDKFYIFCEKVYRILQPQQHDESTMNEFVMVVTGTLEETQNYYADEINELLAEENLAYEFVDGIFLRRGRPQTQKSLQRVSAVLSSPRYSQIRNHYNKAVKFFNERPNADVENCVKEAICALEAFAEILFGQKAAKDFDGTILSKYGNAEGQIPPTIGQSIIKLRAFRGNAKGVAHAATEGGFVGDIEAELVLNLVATYITYLHERFPLPEEDIPF